MLCRLPIGAPTYFYGTLRYTNAVYIEDRVTIHKKRQTVLPTLLNFAVSDFLEEV